MSGFSSKLARCIAGVALGLGLTLGAATASGEAAKPQEPKPLRVLHIGNSFSNNATLYLPALAKAGGKRLEIFGATVGGCSLERHAKYLRQARAGEKEGFAYTSRPVLGAAHREKGRVSLPEALKAKQWDVVTIQQVSKESFRPETFEPHAADLIAEIRASAPTATVWVHQTWAYRPDHALYEREKFTQDQMQARANDAYEGLAKRHDIRHFLPSGLAVQMANRSPEWAYRRDPAFDYANPPKGELPREGGVYLGATLGKAGNGDTPALSFDAYHLGPFGQYLAASVWYEVLFDDSVVEVDFTPQSFTPAQARSLRQLAHEAVAAYRQHGLSGGLPAAAAAD